VGLNGQAKPVSASRTEKDNEGGYGLVLEEVTKVKQVEEQEEMY
jgi:hypothetical protein